MKNAIFFAISNQYCFAAANMLMGLHQHCGEMLETCDIILYHNGLSEKNAQLLTQLHPSILLEPISFPVSWKEMTAHKKVQKYQGMVLCKLFGFRLIQKYDCVLGLDADMLIRGDLSELFTLDTEIAWRKIIAWEPGKVFAPLLEHQNTDIKAGNGGMILFTSKVRKYGIDDAAMIDAFRIKPGTTRGFYISSDAGRPRQNRGTILRPISILRIGQRIIRNGWRWVETDLFSFRRRTILTFSRLTRKRKLSISGKRIKN